MSFNAKEFLERHNGDAEAALTALASDRARATRAKNTVLEAFGVSLEETEDLEAARKRLAGELKAYRDLGKPEDLKAKLELGTATLETLGKLERDPAKLPDLLKSLPDRLVTAEREAQSLRRSGAVRDAADAYGLKASVLERLLVTDNLELAFDANAEREIEVNGKKEKVKGAATLTVDGKPVPLDAHVTGAWADFAPSLVAAAQNATQAAALPTGGGNARGAPAPTVEELAKQKAASSEYQGF